MYRHRYPERLQKLSDSYLAEFIKKFENKLNKPIEEIVIDNCPRQGEIENICFIAQVPEINCPQFEESYKDNDADIDKLCNMICKRLNALPSSKIMFMRVSESPPYLYAFSKDKGVRLSCFYGVMCRNNKIGINVNIRFVIIDKSIVDKLIEEIVSV